MIFHTFTYVRKLFLCYSLVHFCIIVLHCTFPSAQSSHYSQLHLFHHKHNSTLFPEGKYQYTNFNLKLTFSHGSHSWIYMIPYQIKQYHVLVCIRYKPQGSAPKVSQDPCAVPKTVYSRVASSSLYTYNTNPSYTYNRYSSFLYNSHCFVHYAQDLVSLSETSEFR